MIYLGADHRGFELKEFLKKFLEEKGKDFEDLGNIHYDKDDDYPDFAKKVAKKVQENPEENQGILICGSGVGMDIAANRFKKVRSALVYSSEQAKAARNDDDANVLTLAADFTDEEKAREILKVWLATPFGIAEKYKRRIGKIDTLD